MSPDARRVTLHRWGAAAVATLACACSHDDHPGTGEVAPLDASAEVSPDATDDAPGDAPDGASDDVGAEACAPENATRCGAHGGIDSCLGGLWQNDRCPGATVCDDGACLPRICTPGEATCDGASARAVCNASGTRVVDEPCEAAVCRDGACLPGCTPLARRCDGASVLECGDDLVERVVDSCDLAAGEQCGDGRCLTTCDLLGLKRGYIACDFWAADLPNDQTAIDNVFAFAFSNASTREAQVTITYPWGPIETVTVPVGGIATHALPVPRFLSQIAGPGLTRQGFRLQSDQPIAAFMFNPLERYDTTADHSVATNDASILIPAPALGTRYLAVTWSDPAQFSRPPYVTIVATRDDTEVVVTTTETIVLPDAPFVAPKGVATTFTLDAFESLDLEPAGTAGVRTDLTGTRVESQNHPIAVFSGNRCARVPDEGRFCDHVETQLPSLETWGTDFAVAKFTDRGGESDYYRVVAQADDTTLTFDPPRANTPTLAAGKFWQFASKGDFTLTASRPILLAHFMASQSMTTPPGPFGVSDDCPAEIGGTCQGDPALVLEAPVAQWRKDQIFLVPDTYSHQFIDVVFAADTTFTLDGQSVDTGAARAVGGGDWRALTLATSGGYRTLVATQPVGVVVYGYDHNISYAYNGGLDFRALTPP
ncbi:MAG: IgGFc-binding protein [Myxococcota bacterium]